MVLLGTNQRWEQRVKVWRDGWQNLHHRHTRVAARFIVDGRKQPLEVARVWNDGDGVDASTLTIDGKPAPPDALGWAQQLAGYPPLLSHNELEHALDREQSKLYDALAGILGLGDLAAAQQVLQRGASRSRALVKQAREALPALRALLDRTTDERAELVGCIALREGLGSRGRCEHGRRRGRERRAQRASQAARPGGARRCSIESNSTQRPRPCATRMRPASGCEAPTPAERTRSPHSCSRRSTCTPTRRENAVPSVAPRAC